MALGASLATLAATAPAQARSVRQATGYTGRSHIHKTWGGPNVGFVTWSADADFQVDTVCGSSWAIVTYDGPNWNSSSLRNGAELDIQLSVQRTDGRRFAITKVFKITKPQAWPGHPFRMGPPLRATVHTPRGMYLKSGSVTSAIVNNGGASSGVIYGVATDTVRFRQYVRNC